MQYSPKMLQDQLDKNAFHLKKKFGQNFITDENLIDSIVTKADIDKDTLVLEIGPGAGSLTCKLVQNAGQVVCFEIDTTLKDILTENLKNHQNVEIIFEDFLTADVSCVLSKYDFRKIYVVANLPYYITTPILNRIIESEIDVDKIVVMVQKEVGDRFRAKPGTRDYSSLSVYLNYYYDVKKLIDVSRNVFIPKPNVDSIVVEFTKKDRLELANRDLFFKLVRDSFTQKRKNLRNNLRSYDLDKIEKVLSKYGFDLSSRAEQLSIDIFVDIANNLN